MIFATAQSARLSSLDRKLRLQYPGAIYHVMNRGDRREKIFEEDEDRHRFLKTLAEACEKTGWQVHAYCLMSNHFHLVIETPQANFVAGMKQKASSWLCKPEPASISSVEEGLPFPVAMFSNPG